MECATCAGAVRHVAVVALLAVTLLLQSACSVAGDWRRWGSIDVGAVQRARLALRRDGVLQERERYPLSSEEDEHIDPDAERGGGIGKVIVGELLAIFPGVIAPGVGHRFAGDHDTGRRLWRIGEFGYVLTAVGAAFGAAGWALQELELDGTAYGLYGTGAVVGGVGIFYLLSAWFYDMIDTPRAVLSGGEPPPRSTFVESLEIFE